MKPSSRRYVAVALLAALSRDDVTRLLQELPSDDAALLVAEMPEALRDELRGVVDLQLVAFPQQGIYGFPGGEGLMRAAVEAGVDVVGGIPHFELTREDGVASVQFALQVP